MGIVNEGYDTNYMPGWDKESLGYHTDGGEIFQNHGGDYCRKYTEGMKSCERLPK